MKHLVFAILFILLICFSSFAQTPCTNRYPVAIDDADTLCRADDNPQAILRYSINSSVTSFEVTVGGGAPFYTSGLSIIINGETLLCASRSGDVFSSCSRGQAGSIATAHTAGAKVRSPIQALHHNLLVGAINTLEAKLGFGSSTAASAATDDCPKKNVDGTTSWRTCNVGGLALPYDLAVNYDGVPAASSTFRFVAARAFDFASSFTGTACSAGTAATAQTDFLVKVNGTTKATLRFAASGTTCSIVSGTTTSVVATDVVTIIAPASPDATLANVAITLKGVVP